MAKKILKRSLALGALMAFVITGSAMANAPEKLFQPNLDVNGSNLTYSGIGHGGTVTSTDSITSGVISSYSNLTITAGTDIAVTVGTGTAIQTAIDSKSAHTLGIDFKGDLNITANGDAHGIVANANGSKIDIDGNGTGSVKIVAAENALSTSRRDTYNGTKIEKNEINIHDVKNVYIESAGVTEDEADRGHAIYAHNENSKIVIDAAEDVTVKAADGQYAVYANGKGAAIDVNAVEDLEITGDVLATASKNTIDLAGGNATINGDVLAKGYGGTINVNSDEDTKINGTVKITNGGGGGDTINVGGKYITIDAGTDYGVSVRGGYYGFSKETAANIGTADTEKVTIKGSYGLISQYEHSDINVYGKELNIEATERGIYTGNNSDCYNPTAEVNVYSEHTKITMAEGKNALVAFSDSTLNIHGGLEVKAEDAILVRGQSTVNVNKDGKGVVKIDGNINFNNQGSSVHTSANNNVSINMTTADSYLNGKIYVSNTLYENGVAQTPEDVGTGDFKGMTLNLSNGATWNVTGDSFVNELNGSGGNIVFDANAKDVHIDAGSASLNLTMKDQTADDLNDAAGLTTVAERLGVKEAAAETISAKVVMAEGDIKGETTGVVTFVAPAKDENKNEARVATTEGDVNNNADNYWHGVVEEVTEKVNTKNQAIGDTGISLKLHWRAHVNDMNKRMGELRNAEGEHGIWARIVRGESEYKNTKAQYNQYQLGYDEKLSVDKRWTVGAAVTFAEGDANYGQGSTDDKSTAFAIYGSKLNNDGTFVDLIARYAHLESDLDDVNSGKGDYSTNGMSVSAEFGKRIQQGKGLWVEPQVELTYGTIDSAEFIFDGGKTVQVGDMDSLIGRVGFRIGKDLEQGNVYARASYLYDFEGETENTFSKGNASRAIAEDLGGGWWEVGVGANINLSKATYIYADVEKTFGGEVDTNWQWNLGVRYSF